MSEFERTALLEQWRQKVFGFETEVKRVVVGMDAKVRKMSIAIMARGHVMLEGDVGVGKTTLLRAVARGLGGSYERIEGTIDLMPNDLIYHTYINDSGQPRVDPGPILKHGEQLSVFFFNEVNRARPQVHSLLLRIMAERSLTAFNREYHFPYLQVFADRNRVEREETFEIPSAARDRFLMELHIEAPKDPMLLDQLMFDPRFHDVDRLLDGIQPGILPYREISDIAPAIQVSVDATDALRQYALNLWEATRNPSAFGIQLSDTDMHRLILAGASPRGMSMLLRAARVHAWLESRNRLVPEDIQAVFHECVAHRIFLQPVYEMRRDQLIPELLDSILSKVPAP